MELGPAGIRVNAVAPGVVNRRAVGEEQEDPRRHRGSRGFDSAAALGDTEDVVDVIVFLASDASRFVTGETISADGGMARTLNLHGGPT